MSAETQGRIGYWRYRFRVWRWQRPFWAGLLTILAAGPIAYFPYAHIELGGLTMALATTGGAGSAVISVLLVVLGLTMWFQAVARVFAGVASIMLSLVSLVVSNLGGWMMGFLPGLIGGALAVAWAPGSPSAHPGAQPAELPDGDADGGDQGALTGDQQEYAEPGEYATDANGRHSAG